MYGTIENRDWLKENIFSYDDFKFSSDSQISISVLTSTKDYYDFSKLKITISILSSDKNRRKCDLTYSELYELINTLDEVTNNEQLYDAYERSNIFSVDRLISENIIKFTFKPSKTGEHCVVIGIISDKTNYGLTILPIKIFFGFLEKLKFIKDNEFFIHDKLANRMIQNKQHENSDRMVQLLKTFPTQISEQMESSSNNETQNDNFVSTQGESENVESLDSFMESNLDNIKLEGLKNYEEKENQTSEKPVVEVNSKLFENVLNKDISNLEDLVNRILPSNFKVQSFSDTIKEDTEINLLNLFTNEDIKSISYITEWEIQSINKNYLINNESFPETCSIIKTEPNSSINNEIINLSYDLLICQAYMKTFRTRVESRINDPEQNKAKLHVTFRYISDLFIFSFMEPENKSAIKNNIITRFKYFDQNNYFDSMNRELEDLKLNKVNEKDIENYVLNGLEMSKNVLHVKNLHNQLYNESNLTIPLNSNFTLEQIYKEVVKLEVIKYMGYELGEDNLKKFGIEKGEISNEVFKVFKGHRNPSTKTKTNIIKYINYIKDQLSDEVFDSLIKCLGEVGHDNFDFENFSSPIEDLPEGVVKGLYIWNRSNNKNQKFNDFCKECEESVMSKEDIKNRIYSNDQLTNEDSEGLTSDKSWGEELL